MVPDCMRRLATAYEDLKQKMSDNEGLTESEEYKEGVKQLKEAEDLLKAH